MKLLVSNASTDWSLFIVTGDGVTFWYVGVCLPGQRAEFDVLDSYVIQQRSALGDLENDFLKSIATDGNLVHQHANHDMEFMGQAFTGIAATAEVPGVGTVTLPSWAADNAELAVFFLGIATAAGIRLVRAGLRWFKRADGIPTE